MTVADDLHAVDTAFREYFTAMTERIGGVVEQLPGLVLWACPNPSPVIVNGAVRTEDDIPGAEVLATAEAFFRRLGHEYAMTVRGDRDADLAAAATSAGYSPVFELELMATETAAAVPQVDAVVREVDTADDVAAFADVVAAAYGIPDVVATVFASEESILGEGTKGFLAFIDGMAVSSALVHVTGDVGGLYWVGTLESARRRGLGNAVSAAATSAGFELGARVMTLEATPMGAPIYRRLGYRSTGTYTLLGSQLGIQKQGG